MDICEFEQTKHLMLVNYYNRYITVHNMDRDTTTSAVVDKLESVFCLLGIPNSIVTDNSPTFHSAELGDFFRKLDIQHVASSPKFPQSDGEAERAVQTVKSLMHKNLNLRMALCAYRDTPLANGHSPAQLLLAIP